MTARRLTVSTARRALVSLVLFALLVPGLAPAAHAQADGATAQAPSERTAGDWQQYVFGAGAWRPLGVYRVERTLDDTYRMAPVSQSQETDVITSKGLSEVRFEGADWRFTSDWGNGDMAEFRLQRVGPGIYSGWSYLRDEQRNFNLWVLIR